MSDIGEGIGAAAEGGLMARALDPASGAKAPHPDQPPTCRNCATPLVGAYCHACGQAGHVHRTIGAFVHDLLHGALHFEGKLWRTLPSLVLRPGRLTRRYIEGERARFVSPMALFLFSVFLMFAIFQALGLGAPTDLQSTQIAPAMEEVRDRAQAQRDAAQQALDDLPANSPERVDALRKRDDAQSALDGLGQITLSAGRATRFDGTGIGWIDNTLVKKWRDNPSLMLYKLQANSYKFSWLLIPISIPFVALLFAWRRRFRSYDHAIFVTYSLSFMTLLFIVLSLIEASGLLTGGALVLAALLIPPLHLYKQLRHAYELTRVSAAWRLVALSFFIIVIVALFLQLLLVLGAF